MSGEEIDQTETGTCTRCGNVGELHWADSAYIGESMGKGFVCGDCLLTLTGFRS